MNLKVSLVQTTLFWEAPQKNLTHFSKILEAITPTHLIVLPEMFTTGFSMNPSALANKHQESTIAWLLEQAKRTQAAITGSIMFEKAGKFYNRLLFVTPQGEVTHYDKRHRFTLAGEDKVYEAGKTKVVFNYLGWKICPQICYDLRFPVWTRNVEDYDLLLYVANWPEKRLAAWDVLLQARAIENMCFTVGVNRIGIDGNAYPYKGHSAVYDALGMPLIKQPWEEEGVKQITLNKSALQEARQKLRFLEDRDAFTLN